MFVFLQLLSACPPPPNPPGVRHFTMEVFRQSISFSLRFSYRFLTGGTCLKGRRINCWVAWRHPAFLISGILPPKVLDFPIFRKSRKIAGSKSALVKYHYVKPSSPHLSLFHRYKYRNLNFLLSPLFLPVYFHIVPHLAGILQSNKTHLAIDEIVLPIV